MKIALLAVVACMAASSLASYELALVADYAGKKIDRYDPESGTYLGSFGNGLLAGPTDVAIDQANGVAYVADQVTRRVYSFNYHTGRYLSSFAASGALYYVTRLSNGELLHSGVGSANTYRTTTSGTLLQTINTSGIYVEGHAQAQDGTLWFLGSLNGFPTLYSGAVGSSTVTSAVSSFSGNLDAHLTVHGNQAVFQSYTNNLVHFFSANVNGTTATNLVDYRQTGNNLSGRGTAFGHNGLAYMLASDNTALNHRLYKWIPGATNPQYLTLTNTASAEGMAVVVAPEPASMIALGAGALALIRRRRRNA